MEEVEVKYALFLILRKKNDNFILIIETALKPALNTKNPSFEKKLHLLWSDTFWMVQLKSLANFVPDDLRSNLWTLGQPPKHENQTNQ